MKHLKMSFVLLLTVAFFTSCEKESTIQTEILKIKNPKEMTFAEKVEFYGINLNSASSIKGQSNRLDISGAPIYTELCEGTHEGISPVGYIEVPEEWEFYKFFGNEGDVISIKCISDFGLEDDTDFMMSLYFGLTDNISGLLNDHGGDNMEFLIQEDDENNLEGHYSYDPYLIDYTLPYTGYYTLGFYSLNDSETSMISPYEIITTGIICSDIDGDGVLDKNDAHPNSNMSEELSFDGCYPGVTNVLFSNGTTMADEVEDLIAEIWAKLNSDNVSRYYDAQKDFQREMTYLLAKWYRTDRVITDREKYNIVKCVRISRIFENEN